MTINDIKTLVSQGESDTLEFKKSTAQLNEAAKTLCAFLNHRGGYVLLGVGDRGKLIGQQVSDQTRQEIANTLQKFEPPAHIEVTYISLNEQDNKLISLQALPHNQAVPYAFDGRAYRRIQSTTTLMRQEQYQQLLLEKIQRNQRWETLPATGVTINQLDHEEILRTIKKGIACGRISPSHDTQDPIEALNGMGLMDEGHLYNAAVVLFSKKFKPHYPQCKIRLARFKGTEKETFIDNKQIEGHAFTLLEEATTFINRHIPVASSFKKGQLERTDEPFLPPGAIREALVNAIAHRDYTYRGGAVSVAIFDDRLEIWSDGTLPSNISIEQLWKRHSSKPRNELIAGIFYLRELFEEWGRGTIEIIKECRASGHPSPEFFEEAGAFCVRLWAKHPLGQMQATKGLTERQHEIVSILSRGRALALREIIAAMKQPPAARTVRKDLLELKQSGLIQSQGFGRSALWLLYARDSKRNE